MKIIRTATQAKGGITAEEKARMDEHAKLWIARALRTDPIQPEKIVPAIHALYAAAKLKSPRVVIVPSPLVMAMAYGASAAIWYQRKNATPHDAATYAATDAATYAATDAATYAATYAATDAATDAATRAATYAATYDATDAATDAATYDATDAATDAATYAATDAATYAATYDATRAAKVVYEMAGKLGLQCARQWVRVYQGGNMWAGYDAYLTAYRDILGLKLPSHDAYAAWEQAAIHGGFRVMHEEFCMVCDFPERILRDDQNRPHCGDGPSHRWRDGWSLYHWHGVRVPNDWIESRDTLSAAEIFKETNAETRRAGCEIIGWDRVLSGINATEVDADGDAQIGTLYRGQIPGLSPCGFLKVLCGTGREFVIPCPDGFQTALEAQAWIQNVPANKWVKPEVRG